MLAEEASVIEGTLAILKMGVDRSTGAARHVISFAPYTHGGGALRTMSRYGSEALRQFLIELGLPSEQAASMVKQVEETNRAIPNVQLTAEQLKRYGLGEMSIGASIMSYLST
jgi:hypothetical protein